MNHDSVQLQRQFEDLLTRLSRWITDNQGDISIARFYVCQNDILFVATQVVVRRNDQLVDQLTDVDLEISGSPSFESYSERHGYYPTPLGGPGSAKFCVELAADLLADLLITRAVVIGPSGGGILAACFTQIGKRSGERSRILTTGNICIGRDQSYLAPCMRSNSVISR